MYLVHDLPLPKGAIMLIGAARDYETNLIFMALAPNARK